jgi:hypothetical protein
LGVLGADVLDDDELDVDVDVPGVDLVDVDGAVGATPPAADVSIGAPCAPSVAEAS